MGPEPGQVRNAVSNLLYRNVHTDLRQENEPDPLSPIMPVPFPVPVPCRMNEPEDVLTVQFILL